MLQRAAKNGHIDSSQWQDLFSTIVARLEGIVFDDFPLPKAPPVLTPPATPPDDEPESSPRKRQRLDLPSPITPQQPLPLEAGPSSSSPDLPIRSTPAAPTESPGTQPFAPDPQQPANGTPEASDSDDAKTLPPELKEIYDYVRITLIESFSEHPPHTIQRLAELILYPKKHYRFVPVYLTALERVVSVTSGANKFPLPPVEPATNGSTMVNGTSSPTTTVSGPSEEGLGGATLTPVPWLRNGAGNRRRSSTRSSMDGDTTTEDEDTRMDVDEPLLSDVPVSQGELMRKVQEDSEPLAPVHHPTASESKEGETEPVDPEAPKPESELPHARGPDEVGMSDMGPQTPRIIENLPISESGLTGEGPPMPYERIMETDRMKNARERAENEAREAQMAPEIGWEGSDQHDDVADASKLLASKRGNPQVPSEGKDIADDWVITDVDVDGMTREDMRMAANDLVEKHKDDGAATGTTGEPST